MRWAAAGAGAREHRMTTDLGRIVETRSTAHIEQLREMQQELAVLKELGIALSNINLKSIRANRKIAAEPPIRNWPVRRRIDMRVILTIAC
jgi:hypothetical protein